MMSEKCPVKVILIASDQYAEQNWSPSTLVHAWAQSVMNHYDIIHIP